MKKAIFFITTAIFSGLTNADYDANFTGKITSVLTYTHSDELLIRVEGQPTDHPECSRFDYMAIDPSIPHGRRQIVLSRILMAYASGEPVNIGYDRKDECAGSRVKVYRVG